MSEETKPKAKQWDDWPEPQRRPWFLTFGSLTDKKPLFMPLIPEHRVYTEPFLGRGELVFYKGPAKVEVLTDIDEAIIKLHTFARDCTDAQYKQLRAKSWTGNKDHFYKLAKAKPEGIVDFVYRQLYLRTFAMGGTVNWNFRPSDNGRVANPWNRFEYARVRMRGCKILKEDFRTTFKANDASDAFHFIDPPYFDAGGEASEAYYDEKGPSAEEMAEAFGKLKGKVMLITTGNAGTMRPFTKSFFWKRFRWAVRASAMTNAKKDGGGRAFRTGWVVTNYKGVGLHKRLALQVPAEAEAIFKRAQEIASAKKPPDEPCKKQTDIYTKIPAEDRDYRYALHHHWRGKSLHTDLRLEAVPGKLLGGWTLNTQIEGSVKDPVTTLAQAKAWMKRINDLSKIDWTDPKGWEGQVVAERKPPEPFPWLDVEGKTKTPEPGKAPPVGGTANFPGVYHMLEQGRFEYGAQKPDFHEYFFNGRALRDRLVFRETELQRGKAWLGSKPEDQTPYVLSKGAVDEGWMPPAGYSALPKRIRSQVPKEYQFWTAGAQAKAKRDALVQALADKKVKLELREGPVEKASAHEATYVLQEQSWRAPKAATPSKQVWNLRIDTGAAEHTVITFAANPLEGEKQKAIVSKDSHRQALKVKGAIKPGHYLNPTKQTPSTIQVLDSGDAEVFCMSSEAVQVRLSGGHLKGLFCAKQNEGKWDWSSTATADAEKEAEVEKRSEQVVEATWFVPILKVNKEERLVTGVVLEPGEVDAHNDVVSAPVIKKAAHKFLSRYNDRTRLGVMHKQFGDVGLALVESWVSPSATKVGSSKVKAGTWLMTVKVTSDERWSKVKRGEYTGFSIGGIATVQ